MRGVTSWALTWPNTTNGEQMGNEAVDMTTEDDARLDALERRMADVEDALDRLIATVRAAVEPGSPEQTALEPVPR